VISPPISPRALACPTSKMGADRGPIGYPPPWRETDSTTSMASMDAADHLHDQASRLLHAAREFHAAADAPGSHAAATESLRALEAAFQALSAAWYRLAAHSSSGPWVDGIPRERQVHLIATLHDVAAALARSARACRDGRSMTSLLESRSRPARRAA
jgi:hypothetical protein